MNRYPLWKYILILVAVLFGALYTAPNYFGESPALQVSSLQATQKIEASLVPTVEKALADAKISHNGVFYDGSTSRGSIRVRFTNTDVQFKAKAILEKALNPDPQDEKYGVAFNLLSNTPQALQAIRALPMYLGLDLRGGVHFLMQVDIKAALDKRIQGLQAGARDSLKRADVHHAGFQRDGDRLTVRFRDAENRAKGRTALERENQDLLFTDAQDGEFLTLVMQFKPEALKKAADDVVKQNIATLSKRVNELGVAEPLIQQQGADRIVVQLPGVQDVARAKSIIGRTATLEVRMADESIPRGTELTATIPPGSELFKTGRNAPAVLKRDVVITGDVITNAAPIPDQNGQPAVSVTLNGEGGRKMRDLTRDNVGKLMGIVLFEKNKGEVLTVATIHGEFGSQFQITGMGSPEASNELALLLRAGSLAAPMDIIEERTIGPQLGAENIKQGFNATLYGFAAIAVFMIVYYLMFGTFSVIALAVNVLLLVAILSGMQATLTLPGIAAIALALGMAIDSNVLINERVREELRNGSSPQQAIAAGFDRAWATILDSNVTTLIVGVMLWVFGSGPVRGFAVVHCLGILTSMFSAVFVSRGVVNFWYGRKKKLTKLSIGEVWKPQA